MRLVSSVHLLTVLKEVVVHDIFPITNELLGSSYEVFAWINNAFKLTEKFLG